MSHHRKYEDTDESRQRAEQKNETPELYSIFCGEVASIQTYGAFVKIPGYRKNGLVHKSQISAARVEDVSEVLTVGDRVFCKVISLGEEDNVKISLSMKVVDQGKGKDLDANLVQTKQEEQRRKKGQTFVQPRIELGAVFNTVCRKCGTKGHLATDCFQMPGSKSYDLLPDQDDAPLPVTDEMPTSSTHKKKKKKKEKKKKKSKKHRHRSESPDFPDSESDSLIDKRPDVHRHTSREMSKKHQRHRSRSPDSSNGGSSSDKRPHKHRRTSRESREMSKKHHRSPSPDKSDGGLSSDKRPHKHRRTSRESSKKHHRSPSPDKSDSGSSSDKRPHKHRRTSREMSKKHQRHRSPSPDSSDSGSSNDKRPHKHRRTSTDRNNESTTNRQERKRHNTRSSSDSSDEHSHRHRSEGNGHRHGQGRFKSRQR